MCRLNRIMLLRVFAIGGLLAASFLLSDDHGRVHGQGANPKPERLPTLNPGEDRNGSIQGLTYQIYPVSLESGQYFKVGVTQEAMNMYLRFFDPDEVEIAQVDRDWKGPNPETLEAVAEKSGNYSLVVMAMDRSGQRVPYTLRVTDFRQATIQEQERALAERKQCESQTLRSVGRFDESIAPALESLSLRKRLPADRPEDRFDHADILNHLGNVYRESGRPAVAQSNYEQAYRIWQGLLPGNHLHLATALGNLGLNLIALGDYELAKENLLRALAIRETRVEPGSPELIATLNNLAIVHRAKKDYAGAENNLQRVIKIFETGRVLSPNMGTAYANLGSVLLELDKDAEAESALKRALEIYDARNLNAAHPLRGTVYVSMATRQFKQGDYPQAEKTALQAIGIFEKTLNPEHPSLVEALFNLSVTYRALGDVNRALTVRERALDLREKNLRRNLLIGSERQKIAMVAAYAREVNDTLSLHAQFAPNDPKALRLAFLAWLQRKGRVLDEVNRTLALLRRDATPEAMRLLDRLDAKLRSYSQLATGQPNEKSRESMRILHAEIERLQAELSQISLPYRVQTGAVEIEGVQNSLPAGSALIEFARYSPIDPITKKEMPDRYLAYILPQNGELRWMDLGETGKLDDAVHVFRRALSKPNLDPDPRVAARNLDKLLMEPLRPLLGQTKTVFLAPEGELNLAPFAALRDRQGRYLIDDYRFIYLTSGRDLPRLRTKYEGKPDEVIFAVSNFDAMVGSPGSKPQTGDNYSEERGGKLSADRTMATQTFDRLRNALAEGEAVRSVRLKARLYRDHEATETALKNVRRPALLHIASHGFFLSDDEDLGENPLLRSGIALAGANRRSSGLDDGILTAFEAAAMDLWGTKLVILSACETGLGEARHGEGVYGLRRSLMLAGAESQLTSLWLVNDATTKDLMKNYYIRLSRGEGRAEALRNVQRDTLRNKALRHPYYWAGFIHLGEWANLKGVRRSDAFRGAVQRTRVKR